MLYFATSHSRLYLHVGRIFNWCPVPPGSAPSSAFRNRLCSWIWHLRLQNCSSSWICFLAVANRTPEKTIPNHTQPGCHPRDTISPWSMVFWYLRSKRLWLSTQKPTAGRDPHERHLTMANGRYVFFLFLLCLLVYVNHPGFGVKNLDPHRIVSNWSKWYRCRHPDHYHGAVGWVDIFPFWIESKWPMQKKETVMIGTRYPNAFCFWNHWLSPWLMLAGLPNFPILTQWRLHNPASSPIAQGSWYVLYIHIYPTKEDLRYIYIYIYCEMHYAII